MLQPVEDVDPYFDGHPDNDGYDDDDGNDDGFDSLNDDDEGLASHNPRRKKKPAGPAAPVDRVCTCDGERWLCVLCQRAEKAGDSAYRNAWGPQALLFDGAEVRCARGAACTEPDIDFCMPIFSRSHAARARLFESDDSDSNEGYYDYANVGGLADDIPVPYRTGCIVMPHDVELPDAVAYVNGGADGGEEEYLAREADGTDRGWCAWCARVIPAAAERAEVERLQRAFERGGGSIEADYE